MRVISGKARRTALVTPKGQATRPTADRIKENLFNIISPLVPDARFLDIFCGSGAIGIEALSRGAKEAVFIDISKDAIQATRSNLTRTRFEEYSKVLKAHALEAIHGLKHSSFDIIFMDPPYGSGLLATSAQAASTLLSGEGILITEIGLDESLLSTESLVMYDERAYGNTRLVFYKRKV